MRTLSAHRLTKVYRQGSSEVVAVQDVSVAAEAGQVVGIMGPSGSGKTTLLSMLGGILRPTSGAIAICGEDIVGLDERRLPLVRRRYIGFVFQTFNLFAALTAAENVEVALALKGFPPRAARAEALRLLDSVGLAHRARALPRDLSGGEKQRVAIARALAGRPPLILADEPTASLDWTNGRQVMELLHQAARVAGCTVVVVTHDPRVTPYLDVLVDLEDGRMVG
ncbi:MAG TPA: ABC transporter ATP-binding protein [Candidatus Binatia bacterium]|nr:ABC transporter ATP-binding protein [Candidatus Binatia bacterium]